MIAPSLVLLGVILGVSPGRIQDDRPEPVNVTNRVEGQTTILTLMPEGSRVTKGQVVCELDAAGLRDRLGMQTVTIAEAQASVQTARNAVEVSEVEAKEAEAAMSQQIKSADAEVRIAELDVQVARQKLDEARALPQTRQGRGPLDQAQQVLERAQNSLAKARTRRKTLKEVTEPKRKLEAKLNIEKARNDLKTQEAVLALENSKADKLRKQIDACKLTAPIDGLLLHANPDPPRADGYRIEEGAKVRERQVIVRIVPQAPEGR